MRPRRCGGVLGGTDGQKILLLVFATCLACFPAIAGDQSRNGSAGGRDKGKRVATITPVFSELVVFSLPDGFVPAFEKADNVGYIQELVPQGENVHQWSQMITLTGGKGLAANPNLSAQRFAVMVATGFRKACPDTFSGKGLGMAKVGGHDVFLAWASCGTIRSGAGPHSESALIIAVKGTDDYYTIQWAERQPAAGQPMAFDEKKWKARFQRLNPIRFCPVVPGERPPFASCLDRK